MKTFDVSRTYIKNFPVNPGVYMFKNKNNETLYIGKAKNLKNRLTSYFSSDLLPRTAKMISQSVSVSVIEVASEFEALLLEAKLVHKYFPKYNIELKDDKSPLYIAISQDKYPRVLILRKSDLQLFEFKKIYGPFTNSTDVKKVLKLSRKVFPFSQHKLGKKGCIYSQIGLCDPCPSNIESAQNKALRLILKTKYNKNIRNLTRFFNGEMNSIKRFLNREMKELSDKNLFEEASAILSKIKAIDYITQPSVSVGAFIENPNFADEVKEKEATHLLQILSKYIKNISKIERIECFDNAHLFGTKPTASMVTFTNGTPNKTFYRHFRLKRSKKFDDMDMMREVLKRRLLHLEDWGVPDLIIIDGGKPQVSVAAEVIGNKIPFVGLAKQFETLVFKTENGFEEVRLKRGGARNLVQRIRDEAHRFARRYHHHLIKRELLGKNV